MLKRFLLPHIFCSHPYSYLALSADQACVRSSRYGVLRTGYSVIITYLSNTCPAYSATCSTNYTSIHAYENNCPPPFEQVLVILSRQAAWAEPATDPITKAARPAGKEEKTQENLSAPVPAHSKHVSRIYPYSLLCSTQYPVRVGQQLSNIWRTRCRVLSSTHRLHDLAVPHSLTPYPYHHPPAIFVYLLRPLSLVEEL